MKENKNQKDTAGQDLQDYFLAVTASDENFLRAVQLTTPSPALWRRIDTQLTPKEKLDCSAEVTPLRY